VIYSERKAHLVSSYTEVKYGFCFAPSFFVYDRLARCAVTEIYDLNIASCNTGKYDRIRRDTERTGSYMGVYELLTRRPENSFNSTTWIH